MAKAILYDSTLCIGGRPCEEACSARWKLPYNDEIAAEEKTSAHKVTAVRTFGEKFSRKLCMHCIDPACASVCPVAALQKCGDASTKWSTTYKDKDMESGVVRSADNECWSIPKLEIETAKFPFEILVAPCDPKADKQLKFFFSKE